jgi:hypothetical protein
MALAGIVIGLLLIGLFVYSNFYLDERWAAVVGPPQLTSGARQVRLRGGLVRGTVEATLFLAGVSLITVGCSVYGIGVGYGGF